MRLSAPHRETPDEGFPRQNSPPGCFVSLPAFYEAKEFRFLRKAAGALPPDPSAF